MRNSPADSKVREQVGGEGASDSGAEILLQPVVQILVKWVVSLQPVESFMPEQISTLQPVEDPTLEHVDIQIQKEDAAHGETTLVQGKCVRRNDLQRGTDKNSHSPSSLYHLAGRR